MPTTNIHLTAYTQAAVTCLDDTELSALPSGSYSAASAAQDNSTNQDFWADFELLCEFSANPTVNTTLDLFLIPSMDGTNYGDGGGATVPPYTAYVGSFPLRAVSGSQQRIELRGVPLPPGLWKAILYNNGTGQALSTSSTHLSILRYRSYKTASG